MAQLHQLRGRIGRGEHKSYCILLRSDPSKETMAKLAVLEKTSNGFEVAEADWELRGPGDLLGTAQSGLPELKLGNLQTDAKLMQRARAAATKIFRDDPRLANRKINVSGIWLSKKWEKPSPTLVDEKLSQISVVGPRSKRGRFAALRLSIASWASQFDRPLDARKNTRWRPVRRWIRRRSRALFH